MKTETTKFTWGDGKVSLDTSDNRHFLVFDGGEAATEIVFNPKTNKYSHPRIKSQKGLKEIRDLVANARETNSLI